MNEPGTSRHWKPSDGVESHHITVYTQNLETENASLRSRLEAAEERKRKDFWAIRRLEGWLGEARAGLEAAEAELTETRAALEAYRLERREGRA